MALFYSESELDFCNFVTKSASNFVPIFSQSESNSDGSEFDFSSVFINLAFVFFLPLSIYILLLLSIYKQVRYES